MTNNDIKQWEKEWGSQIITEVGTRNSRGETILIDKKCPAKVTLEGKHERCVLLSVVYENYEIKIANVYAPNSKKDKLAFYKEITEVMEQYIDEEFLICGDFNCVLNNEIDIISGKPHEEVEVREFNKILEKLELCDLWRSFHNEKKEFTWNRNNPFIARRLDYCLASEKILYRCTACDHTVIPNSDHKAIVIELNTSSEIKRGPGYWRFNNSYLRNETFVEKMNNRLQRLLDNEKETDKSPMKTWEQWKVEIKNLCIEFGKELSCSNRNRICQLQGQLKELDEKIIHNPKDERAQDSHLKIKQELEVIQI